MRVDRRQFVGISAIGAAGVAARAITARFADSKSGRKRIALIATEVRKLAHAQHFIDRFLEGYGWQGRHHYPAMDLVGLYVDQHPDGDLTPDRIKRHKVKLYPTIAEACTLGTSRLAVDGVVLIGEHGKYPRNSKGQTLYPRYKFFKQVVSVFEDSGRSAPVFNDKHLSTDWRECAEMVGDSRRLGFAFLAGSSLPVTWRIPSLEIPLGTPLEECICVCYGGVDSYDFHGYETAQCMSERRSGGEAGVAAVHALRGPKVWDTIRQRPATRKLLEAALSRSHTLAAPTAYSFGVPTLDYVRDSSPGVIGFFIDHRDGYRTTMLLANGLVQDFTFAAKVGGKDEVLSCQMHLPMPPRLTTLADFFNPLVNNIEEMILTGKAPYAVERTLLTSGMTLFGVESLHRGEARIDTPELSVAYQPLSRSTYWRA